MFHKTAHLTITALCKSLILLGLFHASSSLTTSTSTSTSKKMPASRILSKSTSAKLVIISEKTWRTAASKHRQRIKSLLEPGLTSREDQINTGNKRNRHGGRNQFVDEWTALDPFNPIYNFLIEYYGLKGAKGPRMLARWSPDLSLLSSNNDEMNGISNESNGYVHMGIHVDDLIYQAAMEASNGLGGILLQNANENDYGGTLHLRGSIPVISHKSDNNDDSNPTCHGILYNPAVFYNRHLPITTTDQQTQILKTKAPFEWYASILTATLQSDPVFHCHGLHEWAMQYYPEGSPPPPSAKYQSNLPLRVSRKVINQTVERKGISCTHVDALRFFAPAAGPLNHHGHELQRTDQIRLEQKACVHAHMDLLKIGLKLKSFLNSDLLGDILEIALEARRLDVEASPYDVSGYGGGVVPVETSMGRRIYRDRQRVLMDKAEPVRIRLLDAYQLFMRLSFCDDDGLKLASVSGLNSDSDGKSNEKDTPSLSSSSSSKKAFIAPERYAKTQPGGLPWRKNLIDQK